MSLRACDDRVLVPAIRANSFAAWHAGYATVLPYCERISIVIVFMLTPINGYVPIERTFIVATKEKKSISKNPRFRIFKPLRDNPNML